MAERAPRIGDDVLVTDLTEPALTFRVVEVLAFDTRHTAWQVGVQARRTDLSCIAGTDTTLWVRPQSTRSWEPVKATWRLYDISTPLAAPSTGGTP